VREEPLHLLLQQDYPGRSVFNGGVGGQTSTQILHRFMEGQDKWGDVTVIWAGRNNYGKPDVVKQDIAQMVAQLRTKRYVILSVCNQATEVKDKKLYKIIVKLNKRTRGNLILNNFIDIRNGPGRRLQPQRPAGFDRPRQRRDPHFLRSDKIHLNTAGYQFDGQTNLKISSSQKTGSPRTTRSKAKAARKSFGDFTPGG